MTEDKDAMFFWAMRAAKAHDTMSNALAGVIGGQLRVTEGVGLDNVRAVAVGRVLAVWIEAALKDSEWAERFVSMVLPAREDAADSIALIYEHVAAASSS